jgi:hypothetical protein
MRPLHRPPPKHAEYALFVLKQMFGAHRLATTGLLLLLAMSPGTLTNLVDAVLTALAGSGEYPSPLDWAWRGLPFVALVSVLWLWARHAASEMKVIVRQLDLFRRVVQRAVDQHQVAVADPPGFPQGVDFEDASAPRSAVEEAYAHLRAHQVSHEDIVVDITGGQKICTVVGAAMALVEDRQFQYVSTHDYRVRTYDITYRS